MSVPPIMVKAFETGLLIRHSPSMNLTLRNGGGEAFKKAC